MNYLVSEIITAILSSVGTFIITVLTYIANIKIEKFKSESENERREIEIKREQLNKTYQELISIINLYPNVGPNDIAISVESPPHYSMEWFDAMIHNLDYQKDYYTKRLSNATTGDEINKIKTELSNREYVRKEILEIKDKYFLAKKKYKVFCETRRTEFDLYAGKDVKDNLVKFEMVINNIFIAGNLLENYYDPINNEIDRARRELIYSMRKDIGIN